MKGARGESNRSAKLTDDLVREIRRATGTLKKLAAKYRVSYVTIHEVRARKKWKHID